MNSKTWQLKPFCQSDSLANITIQGRISRIDNNLIVNYLLKGDLSKISFPTTKINPERKDELWQETCFEFFLAIPNLKNYWEFNLAPSGKSSKLS